MDRCRPIEMNMTKVVIEILQGTVVTQTVFGGLAIYGPVCANFYSIYLPKLWLRADKVIAIKMMQIFWPTIPTWYN